VDAAPSDPPPSTRARIVLQQARIADLRGDAEPPYAAAVEAFREIDEPFHVARALLEQAECLAARGRSNEASPLADEARETFERLRARPWLERADRLATPTEVPGAA
jgi:hypothetical protein